jgi:hypothetical protein
MQSDNEVLKVASSSAASPPIAQDAAAQKADLRQFASSENSGNGGLIAQLASNPFFTAVRPGGHLREHV